ncbi:MAG: alpha/beta hydrolase [Lachnospiraceae bacterium]|nr:alpha/beta hydrolase [Lachnospiraceae bacterium]
MSRWLCNNISAFLYAVDDAKGVIVVAPGHRDANDIKLYEIRYFVDAGYSVVCLDYTGCYTSGGSSMKGFNQSVYDIDARLDYIEADKRFEDMPIFLFGHSMVHMQFVQSCSLVTTLQRLLQRLVLIRLKNSGSIQ